MTAEVEYQGVKLQVDPAWVVCAPPDYAPMQKSVRTMWDLMRSVAVNAGMLTRPPRPSFKHDILPIFERMTDLQWVNAGFAAGFGFKAPFNYTSEEWKAKLGNPSPAYKELRRTLSNNFRRYGSQVHRPHSFGPGYMAMRCLFHQRAQSVSTPRCQHCNCLSWTSGLKETLPPTI